MNNKRVQVAVNVGGGSGAFFHKGKIVEELLDRIIFDDEKSGRITIFKQAIISINDMEVN